MLFSSLVSSLEKRFPVRAVSLQRDREVSHMQLLDGSTHAYQEDVLYFGHLAQLPQNGPYPAQMVGVQQSGCAKTFPVPNLAVIREADYAAVVNAIQQQLTDALRAEAGYARMLQTILGGKGLRSILSEAAQRFAHSLAIMDISGKILAHSVPFNAPDPLWAASVERGYCPIDFMMHIRDMRSKHQRPNTSQAFASPCEEMQVMYICSRIIVRGELVGYVFLFADDKEVDPQCYEVLPMISRAASEVIQYNNNGIQVKTGLYRSVISELLEDADPERAKTRIAASGLIFPARMCVLLVRPTYFHGENYVKDQLHGEMQAIFEDSPSVYHHGGIVQIVPMTETLDFPPVCMERLRMLLEAQSLVAGVSNDFSRPDQLSQYLQQADTALRIAKRLDKDGLIHPYSELAFFSLLNQLPMELNLGWYCHPALGRLREYDTAHATELYRTLRMYAQTGFSQKLTAQKLYLHRNTLNYRMQRIEEVGRIDCADPDTMFLLMYSFKIDKYLLVR